MHVVLLQLYLETFTDFVLEDFHFCAFLYFSPPYFKYLRRLHTLDLASSKIQSHETDVLESMHVKTQHKTTQRSLIVI